MVDQALPQTPVAARRVDVLTLVGRVPWLSVYTALALVFLFLPIVMIILFSFNVSETSRFPIRQLTLDWYVQVLRDPVVLDAVRNSIVVALGTAFLAALLGTPAALALTRYRVQALAYLGTLFTLPLALPTLIIGVALLTLFATLTIPLSLGTVVVGHTVYTVPFVFLVVRARLLDMDRYIEEAARDLGATGWRAFWEVTFPLIRSSIVGAMILVFAQSFDMFVITLFTIGPQSTLPLVVWSMLRTGLNPTINAISTLLILTTAILLTVASRFTKITIEV